MEWHVIRDANGPELDQLAVRYGLHPLHVEDCRHRNQSAKVEENHSYAFAVLKPVRVAQDGSLEVSDLDIFLGRDFLITVEEAEWPQVRVLLDKFHAASKDLRPDQVFYRITDAIVDSYLPSLDHFDDRIDELQEEVLQNPTPDALSQIFDTKRSLIVLRRVLVNTRDLVGHLQRTEPEFFQRDMWPFLRDVYDHIARSLDTVEMMRDLLSGALDVYLSSVANRTNQVVKVLTVLGTIALPAVVISSIYGMNLKDLPLLDSPHGSIIIAGVMVATTSVLLIALRLFRWF